MILAKHNGIFLSAWGVSLALHGVVVGAAYMFVAQIKPILNEDIFQWDVALVQAVDPEREIAPSSPIEKPTRATSRVASTQPINQASDMVMTGVAPQESAHVVHPIIEPSEPIEQRVVPPQPKVERLEQKVVEVEKPKVEPAVQPIVEAQESTPAATAEPIVPQSQPVVMASPVETAVESRPSHHEPVLQAMPPTVSDVSAPPAVQESAESPEATSPAPITTEAPIRVAKAVASGPEGKSDHRWLAESLWRRVAELKRYPASARLNGLEGKVVLKAVIRADGHLAEVSVQQSSGHAVLDAAAMEAVRSATPLTMTKPLKRHEIVVSLPIVYSLSN